eukprot:scaffold2741_cov134-Isochrysis_galbana.AAC.14
MLVTELAQRERSITPWMTWTCLRWTSTPLWLVAEQNAPPPPQCSIAGEAAAAADGCVQVAPREEVLPHDNVPAAGAAEESPKAFEPDAGAGTPETMYNVQCLARVLECKESRLMKGDKMGLLPSTRRRWLLEKSNKKQRREWLRPELMPVTAKGCSCCKKKKTCKTLKCPACPVH